MTKLIYSTDEIMAEHAYARPHIEAGYRLHGGFDAEGRYVSPRTLIRWPAVRAWQEALAKRGWPLIDATVKLLERGNYPSFEQQRRLLDWGVGRTLWNALTITGVIEARGKRLVEFQAPDFQAVIEEPLAETATGHLAKGLLVAHGLDEGGNSASGEGGHDVMWFALRDILFGKNAYPDPVVPESIARPELGRLMPALQQAVEKTMLLLMNVQMIEVRAESFFSFCQRVMREPSLFRDRRAEAAKAAELVERIRTDEAIHVAYLQTTISEMRGFTFKGEDGRRIPGKDLIDRIWAGMVHWHAVTTYQHGRDQTRAAIQAALCASAEGQRRFAEFDALEERRAA